MEYEIEGIKYQVNIIRKNNKNTYIRIKDDMVISITTSYFTTKREIKKMLKNNEESILKMLNRHSRILEKDKSFFYLGNSYDIIEVSKLDDVIVEDSKIYIPNQKKFDKWLSNNVKSIFQDRFNFIFNKFEETGDIPNLKIRKMKSRWGVYNRVKHSVTLNSQLIEYSIDKLDYVIVHELCHIIHFNHSKEFWDLVSYYCPDYKKIRKDLKE